MILTYNLCLPLLSFFVFHLKVIIPSNDDGHGIEDVDGVGSTYIEPLPEEDRLDEDNDVPPELIVEPIEEMMETIVNVEQAEASATTTTTSGSTSSNEAGEEEEDYGNGEGFDVATYAVDISTLSDLTKDFITIELGSTFDGLDDAIEFRREVEYDEAVEQQLLLQDQGSSDNNNNNNMRRRGRRRRRHRRALDIAQDSLCDTLDLSDGCEISIEPGIDYLPPNAYFEPFHASQKFEYFEGSALYKIPDPNSPTSSTITAEASLYVRKMTHPTLENKQYISGTLTTGKYDYEFYGDMETGETIMKIVDPEKTPNMPQPLVPPEEDDHDENEYYESSSYGEMQVDGRRRMEGGDDAVVDEEFESFKDQVNRQVQHHLEKERLKQRRRMQSDDGSVIDVLVSCILMVMGSWMGGDAFWICFHSLYAYDMFSLIINISYNHSLLSFFYIYRLHTHGMPSVKRMVMAQHVLGRMTNTSWNQPITNP